ncbi:MAG: hypothetical protein ABFC97_06905 [Anaerolineaceae bacterium]
MFECFIGILFVVFCIAWIIYKLNGDSSGTSGHRNSQSKSSEVFPNGYTRQDYLNKGFTDKDIVTWRLDQNAAPRPDIARKMILDSLDDYLVDKKDPSNLGNYDLNMFQ